MLYPMAAYKQCIPSIFDFFVIFLLTKVSVRNKITGIDILVAMPVGYLAVCGWVNSVMAFDPHAR